LQPAVGRRAARQPRSSGFAGAAKVTGLKDVKGRSLTDARVVCAGVTFPEKLRVAVVGGGPAGASAADALAQQGVDLPHREENGQLQALHD